MKAGICSRMWRPAAGAMLVGALTFAVTAQGGPRAGDGAVRSRSKADSARRLTGPVNNLQAAVAGNLPGDNCTTLVELRPVTTRPQGGDIAYNIQPPGCYTNADISGNEVTLAGPCRVFLNMFISDWDPEDDGPTLRGMQSRVDAMGFMSGLGDDLDWAFVPCANSGACLMAGGLNEPGAICNNQVVGGCNYAWINKTGRDDQFRPFDEFACGIPTWDIGFAPAGPLFFAANDPDQPGVGIQCTVPNSFGPLYIGSVAIDVPAAAKGTYTIGHVPGETLATDTANQLICIGEARPALITVPVGSCCYNVGTLACDDDLTEAECDAHATSNVTIWREGVTCGEEQCPACTTNAACNDNDACTNDVCTNFVCSNTPIAGWDNNECCNAANGATCVPTQAGVCDDAACAMPPDQYGRAGRGACVNTLRAADTPCKDEGDDNPCTYDDVCDGVSAGGCSGTDVNASMIMCTTDQDCLDATGGQATAATCVSGICDCSLVPDLTIDIGESGKADPNCFDEGAKVTATVNVAAATAPVNGGQFRIEYDASCLSFNGISTVAPYLDVVYGPVEPEPGVVFVVVGVGFGVMDGPAGNAAMLELSFNKLDTGCDSCRICFGGENPQNTYLVDNTGQRISVNPICSKDIYTNNDVSVTGPWDGARKFNVDCDQEDADVNWDTPDVDAECGPATLVCTAEHNGGANVDANALNGGLFPPGITNVCCTASTDYCDKSAEDCWTIEVNDQVGLDITIALSPAAQSKPEDDLERCIKFSLYKDSYQDPFVFEQNVTFGGDGDFVGKSEDAIKIPSTGQWDCISAWDQLHTLRSCYTFAPHGGDCVDGRLQAWFEGDPAFCVGGICGNWLIGGNLDGWKKNVDGSNPSLFVIDVLDYGTLVSQWGMDYGTGDTPCGTPGPHADINGDGVVDMLDFTFVQLNFLTTAKECCGALLPAGTTGITEISVRELREMGLGDLAAGDVNGDGLLNVEDVNAFSQGARPSDKGIRGVRKGAGSR